MDTKDMEKLSINQLKSAARGRAGRIKVLEMELTIIDHFLSDRIARGSFDEPKKEPKIKTKRPKGEPLTQSVVKPSKIEPFEESL